MITIRHNLIFAGRLCRALQKDLSMSDKDKKSHIHKIQIRPVEGAEDAISTGSNTRLYLDGKWLRGACFVKAEVHSRKTTKVTIELYAQVEADLNVLLNPPELKDPDNVGNKKFVPYVLSSYPPSDDQS